MAESAQSLQQSKHVSQSGECVSERSSQKKLTYKPSIQ